MTTEAESQSAWRRLITPRDRPQRLAYGTLRGADLRWLADALDLLAWWNRRLALPGHGGRNRIRVVTYDRIRHVRQLLAAMAAGSPPITADDIAQCIDLYAAREWNKAARAWMTVEHFFTEGRLAPLLDELFARREGLPPGGTREDPEIADPRVKRLRDELAEHQRIKAENEALKRRFEALQPAEQRALLEEALAELADLGRPRVSAWQAERQAMAILKRRSSGEEADNGQGATGNGQGGKAEGQCGT